MLKRIDSTTAIVLGVSLCALVPLPVIAEAARVTTGIDEQAQLPYWELKGTGMSLRLVQRLPDQTRGFFLARGFSKDDVELIAQGCVFQTVFRNLSHEGKPSPLSYSQRDWTVIHENRKTGIKTREDWEKIWAERKAPKSSRIAFKWSLYPTTQTYEPGDYNWGMSTIDLRPGSRFDLKITWSQYDQMHSALIEGIQCAPDVEMDPVGER